MMDPEYRRLRYIRYADDFLLGFVGPKREAEEIRHKLAGYLHSRLKLTLSEEKTLITHAVDEKAKFLGYEIRATRCNSLSARDGTRHTNGGMALFMPKQVGRKYLDRFSKRGKIQARNDVMGETDYTIIQKYQAILKGLYNYYCMAVNVSSSTRMGEVKRILEISLTKTLARKFKCHVSEIYRRYRKDNGLEIVLERHDKTPLVASFGGFPFKRIPDGMGVQDLNPVTTWYKYSSPRSEVVQRLLAGKCELCGEKGLELEVHHIRKLADIDRPGRPPKKGWEKIMSARRRKTLIVCRVCHDRITAGKYDGTPL